MKIALTAVAFGLAGFAVAAQAQQITGAGATFPAPVYAKWGELAKAATGMELNYQAIGSGGGQNQILQRTVDFGASDAPLTPTQASACNGCVTMHRGTPSCWCCTAASTARSFPTLSPVAACTLAT